MCTFLYVYFLTCTSLTSVPSYVCFSPSSSSHSRHHSPHVFLARRRFCHKIHYSPGARLYHPCSAPWLFYGKAEPREGANQGRNIKHPSRCLAPAAAFDLFRVAGWSVLSIKYLLTYSGSTYLLTFYLRSYT